MSRLDAGSWHPVGASDSLAADRRADGGGNPKRLRNGKLDRVMVLILTRLAGFDWHDACFVLSGKGVVQVGGTSTEPGDALHCN
jgi:hypothetical protein